MPHWTNHPIVAGETRVRAVHINELHTAVRDAHVAAGLPPVTWTDPVLTTGVPFRAVHFTQLRTAIQSLWGHAGMGPLPNWSAGSAPSVNRAILASDLNDLRTWFELVDPPSLIGASWTNNSRNWNTKSGWDVQLVYTNVPSFAPSLPGSAPWPPDPVCNGGPGGFIGQTVGQGPAGPTPAFLVAYLRAAVPDDATLFRAYCLDGLERWGLPTSQAIISPNGDGGAMQRFQRGVMWYQPDCGCVRRVPYGETLRRVLRGDDAGFPELRSAAVFGLFAPELLYEPPAVHVNRAVGILATGGPTR